MYQKVFDAVEENKKLILDAERYIWENPESGYREWKTHKYLKEKFEMLGYDVCEAGNIPGFYADFDTGRAGPKIAVFGEMDSLIIPTHPECDKQTGAVHACGHNCQTAALLGIAAALKTEGLAEKLCGSVRLIAVPAEEGIELDYREELVNQGIIRYYAGKQEFLYRGYLDGVDMAMLIHVWSDAEYNLLSIDGSDGCIIKSAIFKGKSSHAGGSPQDGKNALYAATNAISVANALRETFIEKDFVRFHPIIAKGGSAVNVIPDEVIVESYIRGATIDAMKDANDKVNRAFSCTAAAMNCELIIRDRHGMSPRNNDSNLRFVFNDIGTMIYPKGTVNTFDHSWGTGSSDMGDIGSVMPMIQLYVGGANGIEHGDDYYITNPVTACVNSAKVQSGAIVRLLSNNGEIAKKVIAEKNIPYKSKEEFFEAIDSITAGINAVVHNGNGTISIKYKK